MPKQARWDIKRKLEEAEGNITSAQAKIATVGERFKPAHVDLYQLCVNIFDVLQMEIDVIKKLRESI